MRFSELRSQGRQLLLDVFPAVLKSNEKEVWTQAIRFLNERIAKMEREIGQRCVDDIDAEHHVRDLWYWQEARRQLCTLFGKKFISISPSLISHD